MSLELSDLIQRNVYLGVYEPHESALVRSWLSPGMTFVDVGANIGYYTALAAERVGGRGRVLAIEPLPRAHAKLKAMVRDNRLSRVETCPFGIAAESGKRQLYVAPLSRGNDSPTMIPNEGGEPQWVEVRTLDECFKEKGLSRIDLLKMDIEGFELEALKGARETLRRGGIRAIVCEFNDHWLRRAGTSQQELCDFITGAGFRLAWGTPRLQAGDISNLGFRLDG